MDELNMDGLREKDLVFRNGRLYRVNLLDWKNKRAFLWALPCENRDTAPPEDFGQEDAGWVGVDELSLVRDTLWGKRRVVFMEREDREIEGRNITSGPGTEMVSEKVLQQISCDLGYDGSTKYIRNDDVIEEARRRFEASLMKVTDNGLTKVSTEDAFNQMADAIADLDDHSFRKILLELMPDFYNYLSGHVVEEMDGDELAKWYGRLLGIEEVEYHQDEYVGDAYVDEHLSYPE